MKKSTLLILSILAIASLVLAGCVDYKAAGDSGVVEGESLEGDVDMAAVETDPVNQAEVVESSSELVTIEANEADFVDLGAIVVDPDNDVVTYYFSQPVDQDGKWQTNYGDAGEYVVTLTASDRIHTVTQDVLLRINRVNVAPVITAVSDMYYSEGETIVFEPQVVDPNGDSLDVKVSGPLASGIFETDHTSSGEYTIRVTASDGELTSEESFRLTVDDVNVLPVISGLSDINVKEGETVEIRPVVEDLDGDFVEVTISEPVGNDGVWELDFTDNGEYRIVVTANDGKDVVTQQVIVNVEDVNMPPQIIDVNMERN